MSNEMYDIDWPASKGTSLQKLSHTHDQMINWLLLNPEKSLRELADVFGYSQAWVSTVIHSDIFQAALKERQIQLASLVVQGIPDKLRRVADIGVEKLTQQLEQSEDPKFVLDATDKILHRLGYAPQSARAPGGMVGGQSPAGVTVSVTVTDLQDAQNLIATVARGKCEKEIEGEVLEVKELDVDEANGGIGRES